MRRAAERLVARLDCSLIARGTESSLSLFAEDAPERNDRSRPPVLSLRRPSWRMNSRNDRRLR